MLTSEREHLNEPCPWAVTLLTVSQPAQHAEAAVPAADPLLTQTLTHACSPCTHSHPPALPPSPLTHTPLTPLTPSPPSTLLHRGELPEGAASEYESARKSYEALHRGLTAMAEALGQPLPHLAEDAFTRLGGEEGGGADKGGGAAGGGSAGGAEAVEHVFEDPEVRVCGVGVGGCFI